MIFRGIKRTFSLLGEDQYNTIGEFWDEMSVVYGLENLRGLGYNWHGTTMEYAIGLKNGDIKDYNFSIDLPDSGWTVAEGETDNLKQMYDEIYKSGALDYEIESFSESGKCRIEYYRKNSN